MEICCICEKELIDGQSISRLTVKGVETILKVSEKRGDKVKAESGKGVHQKCRKEYCRPPKKPEQKEDEISKVRLRSNTLNSSKDQCIFCGKGAKYDGRKRGFDVIPERTSDFQESISKCCEERNDDWSRDVLGRLEFLRDLHAADAVYHQACSVNFRTGKQIPREYTECDFTETKAKKARQGRPTDNERTDAFLRVVTYLEEIEEGIKIDDLILKMEEYLQDSTENAYSITYMKAKLREHFRDNNIFITSLKGQPNFVSLRQSASSIIKEFYNEPKENTDEKEKQRIVLTAAKLIKSEIKSMDSNDKSYPCADGISSVERALDFIPDLLKSFLKSILVGKEIDLKVASIAQAIIQSTIPRMILAPLQLGLAVQLHHHFASRFLIDTLNSHGFCSSYSTVQKYERSAAATQATEIPEYTPDKFIQFVADNVDHNTRTFDGKGTFHGMGIIATVTPGTRARKSVPKGTVNNEDIVKAGTIPIYRYGPPEDKQKLLYKEIKNLKVVDSLKNLDIPQAI